MRAVVVVLGDVARSPRMQYHVLALAAARATVDVIGYVETPLSASMGADPRVTVHALGGPSQAPLVRGWSLWAAVRRGVRMVTGLVWLLFWRLPAPELILVQNPPGVPALIIGWLAARLRSARFAIDWHNLTSAMLALRLPATHPLVRLTERYERLLGRAADANLFVSATMQQTLAARWGLAGAVFRDHPAEAFATLPFDARAEIRGRLCRQLGLPWSSGDFALAVSPTSWTSDEDFDLLFDAFDRCDVLAAEAVRLGRDVPPVLALVTGRGPLRARYEDRLARRQPCRVHVQTLWLAADEYPAVLAAADVGISVHRSASGLDLPMKVLDLLGAGVPVFALDYGPCLSELVKEGENGSLFADAEGLAWLLWSAVGERSAGGRYLESLRQRIEAAPSMRWREAWEKDARPVLLLANQAG
jgi:beta-1,4-mannosyltransferase